MIDVKLDSSRAPLVRAQELRRANAEHYGPWSSAFPHRADVAEILLARHDERIATEPEGQP